MSSIRAHSVWKKQRLFWIGAEESQSQLEMHHAKFGKGFVFLDAEPPSLLYMMICPMSGEIVWYRELRGQNWVFAEMQGSFSSTV